MGVSRRRFDPEFRGGAVRIVKETGKPVSHVARDLGVNEYTLHNWMQMDRQVGGNGGGSGRLTESEQEELAWLRREKDTTSARRLASGFNRAGGWSTRSSFSERRGGGEGGYVVSGIQRDLARNPGRAAWGRSPTAAGHRAGRRTPAAPYGPKALTRAAAPPHRCSPTIATAWPATRGGKINSGKINSGQSLRRSEAFRRRCRS
ncbi:transposase [Nonomuraea sp. NPDC050680]|uniref:transposase n=1 Tax=Nonomuraea sp. NPDC050680 TaxID=3154630 RepID=UPI0033C8CE30